jgi:surface carbohydrate biosynthesis protein
MMEKKKIHIYLPVEIKTRELIPKVILSKIILENKKKNIRCYIGSKTSILRLMSLKKTYGGIFIYKGGLTTDRIKKIKKNVEKFIILDEELGPATEDLKKQIRLRMFDGAEKYIDRYYVIGKTVYNLSRKILPKLKSKIKITGWPRVDMWRPESKHMYVDSVKELRKRYGKFILFSSDFGYNSIDRIDAALKQYKSFQSEWKLLKKELPNETVRAKNVFLEYQKFIKLIYELDKRTDIPQIIIRPHPAEDIQEWKKVAKSLKRIKVIYKGEVSPWIYASSGVLHRGCTSAAQAYMAGIKIGYIVSDNKFIRNSLPYKMSKHLCNLKQIVEFCININAKKPIIPKKYTDIFKDFIHVEAKFASEIVAEDMLKSDLVSELPCRYSKTQSLLDFLKLIINKLKIYTRIYLNQHKLEELKPNKMFGGIVKKEIIDILNNYETGHKLKVRQILTNCIEIE